MPASTVCLQAFRRPRFWIKQNPTFDWKTVTEVLFFNEFVKKLSEVIGSADGLDGFRNAGGKMIVYHGVFDEVIFPRGTYHYYNSVKGSIEEKQTFYRFFPYPNNRHCGGSGPQIDAEALCSALVNWVEKVVAPAHVVASQNLGGGLFRTRKICQYPDVPTYMGNGSTDDQANFIRQVRHGDDGGLLAEHQLDRRFEPDCGRPDAHRLWPRRCGR